MREGKGMGKGQGAGKRASQPGPGGLCECPECGNTVAHERGTPCMQIKCPKCGTTMTRKRQ